MSDRNVRESLTTFKNHEGIDYTVEYLHLQAPQHRRQQGSIVLLHGFPNSKYQFRHVLVPLADAGYNVFAPDWPVRQDSLPISEIDYSFEKPYMAAIIRDFLHGLGVIGPVHLVAHDMGAHVAIHLALQSPIAITTLTWGEAIIPGTQAFQTLKDNGKLPWHFKFHALSSLPETLIEGKEQAYIKHFFDTGCFHGARQRALTSKDLAVYTEALSKPKAIEQALSMYRAIPRDTALLKETLARNGQTRLPVLLLNGDEGFIKRVALGQAQELHSHGTYEIATAAGAGHYVAEEAPQTMTARILEFIARHELY